MADIHPTGNCFGDSIEFLRDKILREVDASLRYILVHAIILDHQDRRQSHSWVEDTRDDSVWTAGIKEGEKVFVHMPDKARFYAFLRAHDLTYYTVGEAQALEREYGRGPPWETRYLALCTDYGALVSASETF